MAETSLSLDELVRKLMGDEHADVLRETLLLVCGRAHGGRGHRPDRRRPTRAQPRAHRPAQRLPRAALGHPRRRDRAGHPAPAQRELLPELLGAAQQKRAGPGGRHPGGLRQRRHTRKVDRLVTQLGLAGISRSAVSRLCAGFDEQVALFRERPLEGRYPYLWLDAKIEHVREPGGVRPKALVIAYGVHETGRREVIGIDVGEAETEAFWREFLRGLRARGLAGVELCVSDAHEGLKAAIAKVLGCPWQRCTVHFLRDMLGHCTKAQQPMIATAIRQIFAAESAAEAHERLAGVAAALEGSAPKVARLLREAEEELLAFMGFPAEHWSKLRSTNPLERVNREVGRRSTSSASTPTTPP